MRLLAVGHGYPKQLGLSHEKQLDHGFIRL